VYTGGMKQTKKNRVELSLKPGREALSTINKPGTGPLPVSTLLGEIPVLCMDLVLSYTWAHVRSI
jgi:hypothetical protein